IAESEAVDTNADDRRPEMGSIEYDHDAMIEAMAEERYALLEQEAQAEDWLAHHDADEPGRGSVLAVGGVAWGVERSIRPHPRCRSTGRCARRSWHGPSWERRAGARWSARPC